MNPYADKPALAVPYAMGRDCPADAVMRVRAAALLGESAVFGDPGTPHYRQAMEAFERGVKDAEARA